jgi:hypothetical protein
MKAEREARGVAEPDSPAGYGADDFALPQEVFGGQPLQAESQARQYILAGGGIDKAEQDSVGSAPADEFQER